MDREKKPWGSARVPFVTNLKTIQERIEIGQPLSQIHSEFQDRLEGMSYDQFTYYVRKYLKQKKPSIDRAASKLLPVKRNEPKETPHFIAPEMAPDMSQYI